MEFFPLLFVPQLLFAGFFIRLSQIPAFLRWAQYLCAIKYAMNLVLLIEFNTDLPHCQGKARVACDHVLIDNDIIQEDWWVYVLCLFAVFAGFRVLAGVVLKHKAERFY